jgi:hypothetical protein
MYAADSAVVRRRRARRIVARRGGRVDLVQGGVERTEARLEVITEQVAHAHQGGRHGRSRHPVTGLPVAIPGLFVCPRRGLVVVDRRGFVAAGLQ